MLVCPQWRISHNESLEKIKLQQKTQKKKKKKLKIETQMSHDITMD